MHLTPLNFDEHCPQWSGLLALTFDRSPEDAARALAWLHEGYRVVAWGAWEADQLVAQYACLHRTVNVNGKLLSAGMSLNMSVHPDWRGRGLIKQVSKPVYADLQAEGAVFGVGFSNAAGIKVDRYSKGYDYQIVGRLNSTLAWLTPPRHSSTLHLSTTLPDIDWRFCSGDPIHFPTTAAHLYHRYMRHPARRYRYGLWQEGADLLGVVVYRLFARGHGAALFAAYGCDLSELLMCWSNAIQATGVHFVHTITTPNARLRRALASVSIGTNLPYSRSPYYLTVKPLIDTAPSALLDFAAWDCMGGEIL